MGGAKNPPSRAERDELEGKGFFYFFFFPSIGVRSRLNSTLMCFSDVHAVGQQTRKLFTPPFRVVKLTVCVRFPSSVLALQRDASQSKTRQVI